MSSLEISLIALIIITTISIIVGIFIWLSHEKQFEKRLQATESKEIPLEKKSHFKNIFGYNIYFTQQGAGEHVVLLHGIGASSYVWRFLTPKLAENYLVTAIDLLGFGSSDKPDTFKYDLDSQCDVIFELLKQLGIQPGKCKCTLIGSSMGGTIALRLAQMYPKMFNKIIVLSPAADPKITFFDLNRISFLSPVVKPLVTERFVKQIMKRVYSEKTLITDENIKMYAEPYSSHKGAVDSFVKSFSLLRDPRVYEQLEGIEDPVLILWGQKDRIIPFKFAKKIQSKIPNSLLEIHKTAGHHLQEDDPEWVLSKIIPFLRD
jgi:pimeloyl-ACP methyl ester carboxylesterase